mmetsp:Transcript_37465/g.73708  ORF Transcript_37465/g.73708 Transcript_37465/m.73708 type:complete len:207 (+) Transcript_37465:420-1040(+)
MTPSPTLSCANTNGTERVYSNFFSSRSACRALWASNLLCVHGTKRVGPWFRCTSCKATNTLKTSGVGLARVSPCRICGAEPNEDMIAAHSQSSALSPPHNFENASPRDPLSTSATAPLTKGFQGRRTSQRVVSGASPFFGDSTRENLSGSNSAAAAPASRSIKAKSLNLVAVLTLITSGTRTTPSLSATSTVVAVQPPIRSARSLF